MATATVLPRSEELDLRQPDIMRAAPLEPQPELLAQVSAASSTASGRVNPVTLRVYTFKEEQYCEMRFETGRLTTTQQIISKILESLGIPPENEQVFSLWLTSKHLQLQLKSYHLPCKLFKRWKDLLSQYTTASLEEVCKDVPILSFQRNAFFPLKNERNLLKKQDPDDPGNYRNTIDLLYHEAVFNTIKGRYPLSIEDLHILAGLQAAVKYREVQSKNPDASKVKLDFQAFYPSHMFYGSQIKKLTKLFKPKKSAENKAIEEKFMKSLNDSKEKCSDPHHLKVLYLQYCWHKPYYGSVFFRGTVEKPFQAINLLTTSEKQVVVAINTECVHLISTSSPPSIQLYLTYDQLSWEFQPAKEEGEDFLSSLLLEFDSVFGPENTRVAKRIQIFSRQAPMMDAMISRSVDCINKCEDELRHMRLQQNNEEFVEHRFKTYDESKGEAPRVQQQELNHKELKLQCTVLTPQGEAVQSAGFTLPRVLKRNKSKDEFGTILPASKPGKEHDTVPLAAAEGGVEMGKVPPGEVDNTQDSLPSNDSDKSLTTDV